jgi:general stress protein YciG
MDPEKQREIASEGEECTCERYAHELILKKAREAGRKGGEAVSRDREHMAEIGQKGGHHPVVIVADQKKQKTIADN